MNTNELTGHTALVTGAAGGIGAAVARVLAEAGVRVAAVDRDARQLAELAGKLGADGLEVHTRAVDVSDEAQVEAAVDWAEHTLGPLHYLVNGAGVLRLGSAITLPTEEWLTTFAVNTTGVFLVSRAVGARMAVRGRGAIVTVASNAAGTPRTKMSAYAASKAASEMFTKCLGLELAGAGVRCNVVAPGSTDTPMLRSMWAGPSGEAATIAGDQSAYKVGIPLGKVASPTDIAKAVFYLLSDQASHITMHTLTVDGGATLGV
ncbi:2,3-dihydro-2,3-dihydroxybenzoate dehydrogenase [Actinospica durhamensis]|uniref:2,3-dihydro-2,3-dihydroxybenzoate dehydrogenase n=1 Tax=Actinospica durhamensis TaxID=1508375 RepID=A0A941ET62_9ACTN|nr:2,3-dihydro-2,3-dihydroxybenzoate dehydrogenase [Actinospica durhamensis]MBR7837617.1 2,3-dihydro-2,3-dihydroxybenzoate dehydrogenase [Actinospica durhamensis]